MFIYAYYIFHFVILINVFFLILGSVAITGSPFQKSFVSGAIDPRKSVVVRHTATLVCTQNLPHNIFVQPRDAYNNPCTFQANDHPAEVKILI